MKALVLALILVLAGACSPATHQSKSWTADPMAVRFSGNWTAMWGDPEAGNSADAELEPTALRDGLIITDEWTRSIIHLNQLNPAIAEGYEAAFVVLSMHRTCPGAPTFSSPADVPDDLDLSAVFPYVFYGLGEREYNDGKRAFGGAGVKMDICGRDEAYDEYLRSSPDDIQGWVVWKN